MTLEDIIEAVNQLDEQDKLRLQDYLSRASQKTDLSLDIEERTRQLNRGFDAMSVGLSEADLAEMTQAMNG